MPEKDLKSEELSFQNDEISSEEADLM